MPANMQIIIDTAKLDELIKVSGDKGTLKISDGVDYGIYQEFTSSGHPSLIPAFERVAGPLLKAIPQAIQKSIPLMKLFTKAAFDIQRLWAADVNVDTGAYKGSIHVEDAGGGMLSATAVSMERR